MLQQPRPEPIVVSQCYLPCGSPPPLPGSAWWEAQAGLQSQDCRATQCWVAEREAPSYPKADLPVGAHLQIEAVGAVPVAVDNVHFAVAVEVRQGHTSPVLVGVVHTWEERQEPSGQRPWGSRDTNLTGAL